MSLANQSLLNSLGITGFPLSDDEIFLPSTSVSTQTAAHPVRGESVRVTAATLNASMIMRSVLSGDAPPLIFIVNDSPVQINVYPAVGEQNNGGTNTALAIPTGQSGIFVRVPNNLAGASSGWRSAVIP